MNNSRRSYSGTPIPWHSNSKGVYEAVVGAFEAGVGVVAKAFGDGVREFS